MKKISIKSTELGSNLKKAIGRILGFKKKVKEPKIEIRYNSLERIEDWFPHESF
jgi:hypothetical protein